MTIQLLCLFFLQLSVAYSAQIHLKCSNIEDINSFLRPWEICFSVGGSVYAPVLLRYVCKRTDRIPFCSHASQDMTALQLRLKVEVLAEAWKYTEGTPGERQKSMHLVVWTEEFPSKMSPIESISALSVSFILKLNTSNYNILQFSNFKVILFPCFSEFKRHCVYVSTPEYDVQNVQSDSHNIFR